MSDTTADTVVAEVAGDLFEAFTRRRAIEPVTPRLGSDVVRAYEVQEALIGAREAATPGLRRIGRKVGLTAESVQRQLGVDQPDFGVLLSDMQLAEADPIPVERMIAPRIEAEIAFLFVDDVEEPTRGAVVAAVGAVAPAFEIVDSRIVDWRIGIADTVADNASSAYFVLGEGRATLTDYEPKTARMTLTDETGAVVSEGTGAACLGDPVDAVVWVAETAHRLGRPLRAGEIVLSGALGPMTDISAGHTYSAEISGLGSVTAFTTPASLTQEVTA